MRRAGIASALMLRLLLLAASLFAALLTPVALPDLFKPIDYALNDWRVRFVTQSHSESRIVVVDVDERSIAEQGPWPWPRATIARLLQILIDEYRVSSIAVDMVFPEPRSNDNVLMEQMRRHQVTGSVVYDLEARNLPMLSQVLPLPLALHFSKNAPRVYGMPVVANHAGIQPKNVGHITPIFDSDGAVRRLFPIICTRDSTSCYPSLTLAAYGGLLERPSLNLQPGRGLFSPAWQLKLKGGDGSPIATVPLARDGTLVIPYRHTREDWISVSATDILQHKADVAMLKGVMVFMGGTALGLSDVIATPISPVAGGLEPHVEILSALLDDDFPVIPQWGLALDALLLAPFIGLLVWLLSRYDKPIQRIIVFPSWLILTWIGTAMFCVIAIRKGNLLLPLSPLLLFPPMTLLLLLSTELYRVGRERAGVLSLLSAYLPSQVAVRLAAFGRRSNKIDTNVDASRREITVLFADIHGFAGLCENQSPEVVARLMHRVFTEMAEAIVLNQGTIDKFIGDAIMAFWNAPEDDPYHSQHALAAAHDIQRRMQTIAPFCIQLGLRPIRIGIGMETGQALVGNFGSAHRRTFTALGEPVILASRIEGLTSNSDHDIIIGESCAAAIGVHNLDALGPMQIRGRIHPVSVYVPRTQNKSVLNASVIA